MEKLNKLKNINAGFFLITLAAAVMVSLINGVLFDSDIALILILSVAADALCFYRFNNGVIAIFRKKYNKPSKKNLRFVDYENIDTAYKNDILSRICDNSIMTYKLNSRTTVQIIKEKDRLRLHKVKSLKTSIVDKSNTNNKSYKSDIFLPYSSIKSITYSISSKNFNLPIITIYTGKKYYRFIGMLEEFSEKDIAEFFGDAAKIKIKAHRADSVKNQYKAEISSLKYNILSMLGIVFAPQLLLFGGNLESRFFVLISIYRLITIFVLLALAVLPIVNNQKYKLDFLISQTDNDNQKDVTIGYIMISAVLFYSSKLSTEINFAYSIILTLILAFVFIALYFVRTKMLCDKNKYARILIMLIAVFLCSNTLITNMNYLATIKTETVYCNVVSREITHTKYEEDYFLNVSISGRIIGLDVSEEVYESSPKIVKVHKAKGILGIEYAGYIE